MILGGIIGIILFGLVMTATSTRMVLEATQDEMKENSIYIREAVARNALRGKMVKAWKTWRALMQVLKKQAVQQPRRKPEAASAQVPAER